MNVADVEALSPKERVLLYLEELRRRRSVEEDTRRLSSLREYMRAAWHLVEPATEYIHGWHLDAIADHLEACMRGEIRNLLITMPPRHGKSYTVAVAWPTWVWTQNPAYRFLFASYSLHLSIRDALRSRRVIQSSWYQERWGKMFSLTGDQNAKQRYENDKTGYRLATSVGGTITGEGGDAVICDDPHNLQEIHSKIIREGVIEWWTTVMATRLNDPKRGVRIIVMQRGHEADLAGFVLKQGGWEHLNLPAEYELDRRKTVIGWSDPRTKRGELLWPERFGAAELEQLKRDLETEYNVAAQLQQRPAPEEGGIFKREYLKLWPHDQRFPKFEFIVQSYDTAFTERTLNDPTACTAWGLFRHPRHGYNCVLLLDAWDEFLSYPDLRKRVKQDSRAIYGEKGAEARVDIVLVEEKGSGISLLQDLRTDGIPCFGYNPLRDDKVARAHAVASLMEAGRVYVMESAKRKGSPVSWAERFLHELLIFPNAERDDYVDTFTQALLYLKRRGLLEAKLRFPEEMDVERPPEEYVNPYAA